MSLLNSKFDIVSVDNQMALAALAQVLSVDTTGHDGSDLFTANGTPATPAGMAFPPGTVVSINPANGLAQLATAVDQSVFANVPQLFFVTIDGNTDYSGAFSQKLTVLQGGFTMQTDQYSTANGGAFTPGAAVTVVGGKIVPRFAGTVDFSKLQIYGFVSPNGLDAVNGVLELIIPQGASAK